MEPPFCMKKILLLVILTPLLISIIILSKSFFGRSKEPVIGVVFPMEHPSFEKIARSLEEALTNESIQLERAIKLKIMNGQGDPNLQRAIIQNFARDPSTIIVPIGDSISQMALTLAPNNRKVCLATRLFEKEFSCPAGATALNDELPVEGSLQLMQKSIDSLQQIGLIYSASEKSFQDVEEAMKAAKEKQISIERYMLNTLSELYTIHSSMGPKTQAVLIFKDSLVVSGISMLIQYAEQHRIPLIASDEGSVAAGAAWAIGVRESAIGLEGGAIINQILSGKHPEEIAPRSLDKHYLFINREAALRQGVDLGKLTAAAAELNLEMIDIPEE